MTRKPRRTYYNFNISNVGYWQDNLISIANRADTAPLSPSWISTGNSMISSDIWHKYHEGYFKIVRRNFSIILILIQFWNITSGICAKFNVQIMLLFVYTTTRKRLVIFPCRYFKLSWNIIALSQLNCRNFSCSGINVQKTWGKGLGHLLKILLLWKTEELSVCHKF